MTTITITLPRATVEQALEALELGYDSAKSEADQYHAAFAGYKPQRHAQMDADVQQIAAAITALRAALAQQAEPVEPVAHRVVAGALFDFMGWLTSRRERLVLSSTDDAAPAADAIKDFAEMRGLSLDDAKVQDWNAAPPQQAEPVEPVAWSGYDLDGMVEAFSRVIEAHHSSEHPFHNPIDMDAQMALRILRGFIPAMKAYTAPPQRKPLPKHDQHCVDVPGYGLVSVRLVRAVERAHGIKENPDD